ncbi:MAG: helix-turn-helix transcriptional regulator [Rhodoferax sp.]|jgi:transcriptional regulator with XRE-family HTH domain|nr:helix-turn-helix transcriptional regulator [Rhodoferax sp.]
MKISKQIPDQPEPSAIVSPLLTQALGSAVRELRQRHKLTIAQVSEQAGISRGMLSKIETGQITPGLDSLSRIARALGVSMSMLFRHYDAPTGSAQHVKKGQGMEVVRRGTKSGHSYELLAYDQGPVKLFEPFMITMEEPSESFPTFQHPGTEFIHMIEGTLEYRHGQTVYVLEPGDTLTFEGEITHGPERLLNKPVRFLSLIIYGGAHP